MNSNYIAIIVGGIYTLIYLIVFMVQKTEIDKIKEINNSMKNFFDIFKVDEVKKYVELSKERILMETSNLMLDDPKLKKMVDESIDATAENLRKIYFKQLTEQNEELLVIVLRVLQHMPKEERGKFVETHLTINSQAYLDLLDELEEMEKQEKTKDS